VGCLRKCAKTDRGPQNIVFSAIAALPFTLEGVVAIVAAELETSSPDDLIERYVQNMGGDS
jgi:hypothetical protein